MPWKKATAEKSYLTGIKKDFFVFLGVFVPWWLFFFCHKGTKAQRVTKVKTY